MFFLISPPTLTLLHCCGPSTCPANDSGNIPSCKWPTSYDRCQWVTGPTSRERMKNKFGLKVCWRHRPFVWTNPATDFVHGHFLQINCHLEIQYNTSIQYIQHNTDNTIQYITIKQQSNNLSESCKLISSYRSSNCCYMYIYFKNKWLVTKGNYMPTQW